MIVSNLPSLPTFLIRSVLKSIGGKPWLGRLPSLPILKARVHQYCQQSLADTTSCRQMPRKPRQNMPIFVGFVGKPYFAKAMPTMPRNWPRTFCKGRILQATEHAQNHVTVDLMLKSSILFISLDRNNDYKHLKQLQNLFFIFTFIYVITLQIFPTQIVPQLSVSES